MDDTKVCCLLYQQFNLEFFPPVFVFVCVCTCQLQTDGLDVNVPNSDGVTAVMLAVRDVDLFEDLGAHLPWEHKPVEVIKELLGVSA